MFLTCVCHAGKKILLPFLPIRGKRKEINQIISNPFLQLIELLTKWCTPSHDTVLNTNNFLQFQPLSTANLCNRLSYKS